MKKILKNLRKNFRKIFSKIFQKKFFEKIFENFSKKKFENFFEIHTLSKHLGQVEKFRRGGYVGWKIWPRRICSWISTEASSVIFFFHRGATRRGALTGYVSFWNFVLKFFKSLNSKKYALYAFSLFHYILAKDRHFFSHVHFGRLPLYIYYQLAVLWKWHFIDPHLGFEPGTLVF